MLGDGKSTILPYSTLNDHEDYIRSIVLAPKTERLFSASDDGKVLMWDLNAEKCI